MKSDRPTFEAELAAVREELIRLGVQPRETQAEPATNETFVIPAELMTTAYEMAGYAVATLALSRNVPEIMGLKEDNEYDLGKCTEIEVDVIWTVGHMAGELSRAHGCSGEQGLITINFEIESSMAYHKNSNLGAETIRNQNWGAIVRVAQLLIERGVLSRTELEGAVSQSDAGRALEGFPLKPSL
jgi:hypothetical protein